MSVSFKSPSTYKENNELFDFDSNKKPIRNKPLQIENLHQEFMNAIQKKQSGFFLPVVTTTPKYQHPRMEDFQPIQSAELDKLMKTLNEKELLLIDVRSMTCYLKSRIRSSIHISIPSILLKRPSYTLEKVCESIQPEDSKFKLLHHWHEASYIIFYDRSSYKPTDSCTSTTSILLGSKLRHVGYQGYLNYLEGGFNEFQRLFPNQCDTSEMNDIKKPKSLPLPTSLPLSTPHHINPFFSNIRQNLELAHGPIKERIPIRLPFGLSYDKGLIISKDPPYKNYHPRFGLAGTSVDKQGNLILPSWLKSILDPSSGPKKLAELYEELERTEQARLSAIMDFHSKNQNNTADEFPFSISSSLEKGAFNRYDNIWPYEFSRVKSSQDRYINANYVQFSNFKTDITTSPIRKSNKELELENKGLLSEASVRTMAKNGEQNLKSTRSYICTQGPLPTTFNDFWDMVWNERSNVIVMLTKEVELNKIKCHRYWPSEVQVTEKYGDLQITLLSETKQTLMNTNSKRERQEDDIITRQFQLDRDDQSRVVTHLQYPSWSDFGVPDLPTGLLQLIQWADEAHQTGPMIVHCSAGCGRSGTFCVVDTVIQRLWHDMYTNLEDQVFETVARFREQRMSTVQTHRQFVFCYETVVWWLLGYGFLPVSSSPMDLSDPSFL